MSGIRLLLDPELPATAQPGLWADELSVAQRDLAQRLHIAPTPLPPILLVASRARLHTLTGVRANGLTDYQAPALLFVHSEAPNRLAIRHELGHWMPFRAWQGPYPPDWIGEGLATWAQARCSGYPIRAAAATLATAGRLPSLTRLAGAFRSLPELPAYLAAGSLVGYLDSLRPELLRTLWRHGLPGVAALLETDVPHLAAGWQAWLAVLPSEDRPAEAAVADACTQ